MFDWWEQFAAWLTGLPLFAQFALVMVVLVPLCGLLAAFADRVAGWLGTQLGGRGAARVSRRVGVRISSRIGPARWQRR